MLTKDTKIVRCFMKDSLTETFALEENIPELIMKYGIKEDLEITTFEGEFLLNTFGYFLNEITPECRAKIIDKLVQYQRGEKEPEPFTEFTDERRIFILTNKTKLVRCFMKDSLTETFASEENISELIMKYGIKEDLEITTLEGEFLLNTFGYFLNKITPECRAKIIDKLVQYQMYQKELEPFTEYTREEIEK